MLQVEAISAAMKPTTISARDEKLLMTFPRPPTGKDSPPEAKKALPPSPPARPGDFGYIPVSTSREDDSDSLYDFPEMAHRTTADLAAKPLPSIRNDMEDLQIVLDHPSKIFAPTETITGYILGWNPICKNLHIILEGRGFTYLWRDKMQYKDRVPLVYQITRLDSVGLSGVPRFSIRIPERTTGGLGFDLDECSPTDPIDGRFWRHDWPIQEPFEHQAGHPLPPTLTNMPIRSTTSLAKISHAEGFGKISYKLIAIRSDKLQANGQFIPDASWQIPIRLTTRRLPSSRVQELTRTSESSSSDLSIHTTQLLKERRLSFREQLRDSFSTHAPTFYFRANISSANLSVPGGNVQTTISLSVLPPPPGKVYNFAIPDVLLKTITFRVRSHTGLRNIRKHTLDDNQPMARSDTFKHTELQTTQTPTNTVFTPNKGDFEGQTCVGTFTLPQSILPSFKTYSIWLSYRLRCDVVFLVAGKEVSMTSKSDLNIVAKVDGQEEKGDDQIAQVDMRAEDEAASLKIAQAMVKRMHV